jgi:D-galactose 1-dehydrogenase
MTIRIGLVGLGKIAETEHLPAIAATGEIELAAVASRNARLPHLPCHPDIESLLAAEPCLDAVTLCTPPQGRFAQARAALAAGKHVMLEKPPAATLAEALALREMAACAGVTLFATWHSRRAPAVEPARSILATRRLRSVDIVWKENVRVWHPGQQWIWQAGGLGVFDPGINALSIVTRILPKPIFLQQADLFFPSNRQTPIAARLQAVDADGLVVKAEFDWRPAGPETWEIRAETDEGSLVIAQGGHRLIVDGVPRRVEDHNEYFGLYADFVRLIEEARSDADLSPLILVSDAFLLGSRHGAELF